MDDLTTLILIAVLSVGIGAALGSLITYVMSARQKESKPAENKSPGLAESARVYRDTRSGTVVLEVKGKKYHKPGDLDAAGRAFIEQQLATLLAWVKPAEQAQFTRSEPQVSATAPPPEAVGSDLSSRLAAVLPEKEPTAGGSPEPAAARPSPEEGPKPSYNPLNVFSRALQSEVRKPAAPSASIAAQIDEILQEKLAGLPDEKRAIRLMELPGKGMVVMVGLDQYDGVEAVPDPEVRTLIRSCVSEWEQRLDRQE